jgi:hypothetical protein
MLALKESFEWKSIDIATINAFRIMPLPDILGESDRAKEAQAKEKEIERLDIEYNILHAWLEKIDVKDF